MSGCSTAPCRVRRLPPRPSCRHDKSLPSLPVRPRPGRSRAAVRAPGAGDLQTRRRKAPSVIPTPRRGAGRAALARQEHRHAAQRRLRRVFERVAPAVVVIDVTKKPTAEGEGNDYFPISSSTARRGEGSRLARRPQHAPSRSRRARARGSSSSPAATSSRTTTSSPGADRDQRPAQGRPRSSRPSSSAPTKRRTSPSSRSTPPTCPSKNSPTATACAWARSPAPSACRTTWTTASRRASSAPRAATTSNSARRQLRGLHPDRRLHQPRQLRRPAGEPRRQGHRHEHAHQRPQPRPRLRHSRATCCARWATSSSTRATSSGRTSACGSCRSTRHVGNYGAVFNGVKKGVIVQDDHGRHARVQERPAHDGRDHGGGRRAGRLGPRFAKANPDQEGRGDGAA